MGITEFLQDQLQHILRLRVIGWISDAEYEHRHLDILQALARNRAMERQ